MSKINPKVKKLYYSIGEVSEMTDLKSYVLRYWETEFNQLNLQKIEQEIGHIDKKI